MNEGDEAGPGAASISKLIAVLLLVTAISAGLRLTSPAHGLPCDPEPDLYTVRQVETLREDGLFDRHLAGWKYPLLFSTMTAALPWEVLVPPREAPLEDHLKAASTAHIWTRIVTGVVASLAAPLTLLVALRFFGLGAAALAGLFVATSGMHLWMSVQARPHAPAATLVLLALIACLRWADHHRRRDAIFAGIAVGLSCAALHSGLSALFPWAMAAVIVLRRGRKRAVPWIMISLGLATLLIVWAYGLEPHAPRDWHLREQRLLEKSNLESTHLAFGGHLLVWSVFNGRGFAALAEGIRSLDPVIGVLAVMGLMSMVLSTRRGRDSGTARAMWMSMAVFLPLVGVFGAYELSYWRFFLPALPAFALASVAGLLWVADSRGLSKRQRWAGASMALAFPMAVSIKIAMLVAAPSSYRLLADQMALELRGAERRTLQLNVRPLPFWAPEGVLEGIAETTPNRWLRYQRHRLNEWSDGPPQPLPAEKIAGATRLEVLRAPDPSEAAAQVLGNTDANLIAMSTCWPLPVDDKFRSPELAAWREALTANGWQRTHVVQPQPRGLGEGVVPKLTIRTLFSRTALGLRYEIWARETP